MPPHLANQNANVATKHAYLNQKLAPLSLSLSLSLSPYCNNMSLPLSVSAIDPSLKLETWRSPPTHTHL